jgi:hypothetical protein
VGAGGRNEPSLYAHMNNKRKMKKKTKGKNKIKPHKTKQNKKTPQSVPSSNAIQCQ